MTNIVAENHRKVGYLAEMQPISKPKIDKHLVGKVLEICEKYNLLEGGSELRWSQGVVQEVSNGSNIVKPGAQTANFKAREGVCIKFDANIPHIKKSTIHSIFLLPTK